LYHATNSLWTPVVAHFINNSVYNFIHLETAGGLDKGLFPVQMIATLGLLPLMLLVALLAR
jgi:membrane protease YdiL (CAAX protease family)